MALLAGQDYRRVFAVWSQRADYKAVSAAAYLGGTDPGDPNSAVTLNLKTLPGMTPDVLTSDQATELARKGCELLRGFRWRGRVYQRHHAQGGRVGGRTVFLGLACGQVGERRIQLHEAHQAPHVKRLERELCSARLRRAEQAVIWRAERFQTRSELRSLNTIGNPDFDGVLPLGYFLYVPPESKRTQANRDARTIPGRQGLASRFRDDSRGQNHGRFRELSHDQPHKLP